MSGLRDVSGYNKDGIGQTELAALFVDMFISLGFFGGTRPTMRLV